MGRADNEAGSKPQAGESGNSRLSSDGSLESLVINQTPSFLIGQLYPSVSHRLKQSLSIINMAIQTLELESDLTEKKNDSLNNMSLSVNRQVNDINNLIDSLKILSGTLPIESSSLHKTANLLFGFALDSFRKFGGKLETESTDINAISDHGLVVEGLCFLLFFREGLAHYPDNKRILQWRLKFIKRPGTCMIPLEFAGQHSDAARGFIEALEKDKMDLPLYRLCLMQKINGSFDRIEFNYNADPPHLCLHSRHGESRD